MDGNKNVVLSNRSRSKKATIINTQPEGEMNSSGDNIGTGEGQNAATQNNAEALTPFEQDSNYRNETQQTGTLKNQYINSKMQNLHMRSKKSSMDKKLVADQNSKA